MGHDEDRHAERVLLAPVPAASYMLRPTTIAPARSSLVEVLGILALGLALRPRRVAPGPAEDPVVKALTAFAESLVRAVVRAGDVAVHRCRDRRDDLRHSRYLLISPSKDDVDAGQDELELRCG